VLESWELPTRNDVGALRLRMVGLKNMPADKLQNTHVEQNGKRVYHPNVVLDLDYTVIMPRR
jgi:2-methylfumaryl-CoA hydratase